MRSSDVVTEPQNSPVPSRAPRASKVAAGEASRICCPTATFAMCHTASQNANGQSRRSQRTGRDCAGHAARVQVVGALLGALGDVRAMADGYSAGFSAAASVPSEASGSPV